MTGRTLTVGDHRPHVVDDRGDDFTLAARPLRRPAAQRGCDHPGPLAEQLGHVQFALDAALHADDDNPAVVGERVDVAAQIGGAHDVEDHVGARAVRRLANPFDEILFAVVDQDLGAEFLAELEFRRRPRRHRDPAVERPRNLDRVRTDAARTAVQQHRLACRQTRGHHKVGPHGARHFG